MANFTKSWGAAVIVLLLFLVMTFGGVLVEPPAVRKSNTADQFDTMRAFSRLETILGDQRPHPVDTDANDAVRARLIGQIKALGFTPEVTEGPACYDRSSSRGYVPCAYVTNVSFRMGPADGDIIMVTTHYDSVPAGSGAGDAGLGVATLLEIAHVLESETLTRPLLFMFTDGEEGGLLGANYFVRDDPIANQVKTIVNFEARGNRGPVFMFETSRPNGRVIPAYAKNIIRPNANSVMSAVSELIPNTTDVEIYLPYDYEAINFAVVHGLSNYHTPLDNLQNLSKPSLQHMGDQGLSSVRTMATEARSQNDGTYIYADILSRFIVVLPVIVALPLLIIAGLSAFILFWRAEPKKGRFRAFSAPLLILILAGSTTWIVQWILIALRGTDRYWWAHGWATQGLAAFIAILSALIILRRVCPRADWRQLTFAGWFWFLIPGFVCAAILPNAIILFVLPAIAFLISCVTYLGFRSISKWAFALAAIFTLIILVPLFASLGVTLGYGIGWMIAIVCGLALCPSLGALLPIDKSDGEEATDIPLWVSGAGVLALFIAALALPSVSVKNPIPLNVNTFADLDNEQAFTTFGNRNRPAFTDSELAAEAIMRDIIPGFGQSWSVAAPMPDIQAPTLEITDRTTSSDGSTLITANIAAKGANRVGIMIPKDSGISSLSFQGISTSVKTGDTDRDYLLLRCSGRTCDGTEISAQFSNTSETEWLLYGEHWNTPPSAQVYIDARPNTATPLQAGDRTVVIKRQSF